MSAAGCEANGFARCAALPIWFSALLAAECMERAPYSTHLVDWRLDGALAKYTNCHTEPITLDPFNIVVDPGKSLAVLWEPGMSTYTVREAD